MRSDFVKPLLLWYNTHGRDLPWRRTKDPYRIWVSEIMLQQTRVEAVKGYYERFLHELPDIYSLSLCPEERLLKLWEGLGYYSRARNLQKAAVRIMEEYGGKMPDEADELKKLPGIGDYTAGAVASIAFGKAEAAVDGNLIRVISRIFSLKDPFSSQKARKELAQSLRKLELPEEWSFGDLNQAFMDLGATVCLPNAKPVCEKCPVADHCAAHRDGEELKYPVKPEKKARAIKEMTVMIIRVDDRYALRKRPSEGLLAGLYEFPNTDGFLSADEAACCAERMTGAKALKVRQIEDAKHIFSHIEWHMMGYEIRMSPFCDADTAQPLFFADKEEIERSCPIPSAFAAYASHIDLKIGKKKTGL